MFRALSTHWPEYVVEAAGLMVFMISAGAFGTLLEFPGSPAYAALPDSFARRALMGLAMGLTAVALIYSPWGRQSGAHLNPATTLTFWRLGKVAGWDAAFYVVAQFAGGLLGVVVIGAILECDPRGRIWHSAARQTCSARSCTIRTTSAASSAPRGLTLIHRFRRPDRRSGPRANGQPERATGKQELSQAPRICERWVRSMRNMGPPLCSG